MRLRAAVIPLLLLSACAAQTFAAAPAPSPTTRPKSETFAPRISSFTFNPDGTVLAVFDTKDKQDNTVHREYLITPDTIINVNGTLTKSTDITDDMKKDVVAGMVGEDGRTGVLLRWGRVMLNATEADLTPKQAAMLKHYAPVATQASNDAIDKRVDSYVAAMKLNSPDKEARVKDALRTNLRAVREAHNAWLKPAKSVRDDLNKGLAADLSPEQVDAMKNLITGNQVERHLIAYRVIVPTLSKEEEAAILVLLKEAREEGLNAKNTADIVREFQPYKDKIEKYLISKGHDWKKLYSENAKKEGEAQKAAPPAAE